MSTEADGVVRLFPLPDLVLFPHVGQRLHVFEPRYRQLMADSLEDDRQFAVVCLRPGWEDDYHKSPGLCATGCLGAIRDEERLPDGRYFLWLYGRRRVRLLDEVPCDRLYRTFRFRWLDDLPVEREDVEHDLVRRLARALVSRASQPGPHSEMVSKLLKAMLPLGAICDVLSFVLPMATEARQGLLDEPGVEARARLLLQLLEPRPPTRTFPPTFSAN